MSDQNPPTVMVCVFGKPKKKKTSDVIAAFPNGLFIGVPSAIKLVANNELGIQPAVHPHPPQILPDLVQMLEQLSANPDALKPYGALIIDDASHICQRSMLYWQDNSPTGRSGKKDRFYQYQQLNRHLLQLAGLSRHLGVHLAMTFHERQPGSNVDGMFCPRGVTSTCVPWLTPATLTHGSPVSTTATRLIQSGSRVTVQVCAQRRPPETSVRF